MFIGIQIAQVIAAPIPGEATGFIGGYVFGTLTGFIYSTIGLTIGSLINFGIGRILGERFVRRLVPKERFQRMDRLINRQGVIALFIMFAIPGFPKDYLCLALGLSTLPVKLFALMTCVGRMPGTLMLEPPGGRAVRPKLRAAGRRRRCLPGGDPAGVSLPGSALPVGGEDEPPAGRCLIPAHWGAPADGRAQR